jgi:hypothetical protein
MPWQLLVLMSLLNFVMTSSSINLGRYHGDVVAYLSLEKGNLFLTRALLEKKRDAVFLKLQ